MAPLRIAFISPCVPGRNGVGWCQRTFQFLSAYARLGRVELVAMDYDGTGFLCSRRDLGRLCHKVAIHELDPAGMRSFERAVVALVSDCDVVHVTRDFMVPLVMGAVRGKTPILVDLDEDPVGRLASQRRWERVFELPSGEGPPGVTAASVKMRLRAIRDVASLLWVCSDREVARLRSSVGRGAFRYIPNPGALRRPRLDARVPRRTLLFVGNLNVFPNIDAVRFLIETILPIIQRTIPDVEVLVVGRGPGKQVRELARPGVRFILDAPDVRAYYRRAAVAVSPVRYGAGTRVKILEAFGQGVPVVSTRFGCEGLDVTSGQHLVIADSATAFARACVTLLRSPSTRNRLAERAWRLVETKHTPRAIVPLIVRDIREIIAAPVRDV